MPPRLILARASCCCRLPTAACGSFPTSGRCLPTMTAGRHLQAPSHFDVLILVASIGGWCLYLPRRHSGTPTTSSQQETPPVRVQDRDVTTSRHPSTNERHRIFRSTSRHRLVRYAGLAGSPGGRASYGTRGPDAAHDLGPKQAPKFIFPADILWACGFLSVPSGATRLDPAGARCIDTSTSRMNRSSEQMSTRIDVEESSLELTSCSSTHAIEERKMSQRT